MAQKKNTRNCEGVCKKLYHAVSPFRARICRLSHLPQASIAKEPLPQNTDNPVENSSPQAKPVHSFHQPSLSKTIPVEFEPPAAHFPAQKNKKLAVLPSPAVLHSAGKGNSSDFAEREIQIVGGQKFATPAARMAEVAQPQRAPTDSANGQVKKVGFSKAKYSRKDDDSFHEGRFSEYIDKVKNRMMKTASNVGGDKSLSFR